MEEMSKSKVTEIINQFIAENYPKARQGDLKLDDQLLGKGVIDSLGLFILIEYLEKTFEIAVSDLDVNEDNFGTITALSEFVNKKVVKEI